MDTEKCLKLWRDRILITKRKELSPSEVASLFQQKVFKLLYHLSFVFIFFSYSN
jgi:hypothetical protein